ncbi:Transposase, Ptta/En/Spm, plant [Corchorus olitorius]|uniref:Transposase, Ptta/En/Spm, plant n=1 Tax=Corchorus olitorius TaxID=93759 RepID=A0A1R3HEV1_9ROSI|nr:Transposase, Ptta/En/Spm, plant [Corchorus olitorius]
MLHHQVPADSLGPKPKAVYTLQCRGYCMMTSYGFKRGSRGGGRSSSSGHESGQSSCLSTSIGTGMSLPNMPPPPPVTTNPTGPKGTWPNPTGLTSTGTGTDFSKLRGTEARATSAIAANIKVDTIIPSSAPATALDEGLIPIEERKLREPPEQPHEITLWHIHRDKIVKRNAKEAIETWYKGFWPYWTKVPKKEKEWMFKVWKTYYTICLELEKRMFKEFEHLASKHIGKMFTIARVKKEQPRFIPDSIYAKYLEYCKSKEFLDKSDQNKQNRAANGVASIANYCGGCISAEDYMDKLREERRGEEVTWRDVFKVCYTDREGNFPEGRSREIIAIGGNLTQINTSKLWEKAAKSKRGRIIGMGETARHLRICTRTQTSQGDSEETSQLRSTVQELGVQLEQSQAELAQTQATLQNTKQEADDRWNLLVSFLGEKGFQLPEMPLRQPVTPPHATTRELASHLLVEVEDEHSPAPAENRTPGDDFAAILLDDQMASNLGAN